MAHQTNIGMNKTLGLTGVTVNTMALISAVSPQLAAIVARCLQRDPNDRYADLHAFIAALGHPEEADLAPLDRAPITTIAAIPWYRSSAIKAIVIAFAIMVVIAALALLLQSARVQ